MQTISLYKRYIVVAALTMIGLAALSYALEVFAGVDIGSASGIVAAMVPAMDAGQTYAKRWGKRPENGYAWKVSAVFVVLNLLIGVALMVILLSVMGGLGGIADMLASIGTIAFGIIMAVVLLIYWLASRFFFGFGAKNQIKAEERLAAKKQP